MEDEARRRKKKETEEDERGSRRGKKGRKKEKEVERKERVCVLFVFLRTCPGACFPSNRLLKALLRSTANRGRRFKRSTARTS
jgi:hypothetical protein